MRQEDARWGRDGRDEVNVVRSSAQANSKAPASVIMLVIVVVVVVLLLLLWPLYALFVLTLFERRPARPVALRLARTSAAATRDGGSKQAGGHKYALANISGNIVASSSSAAADENADEQLCSAKA